MNALSDSLDRRRALTVLDQTLLVEAAAGTGKTSLLAGRVTMLLADGVAPRNIAAITFTELAAGELLLIDNQIDQSTSTIRLKARFPNSDNRLWPGEFVRVRILADTRSGVLAKCSIDSR